MAERLSLQKIIGVTEARNHLGNLLSRVLRGEEHLVVQKAGVPVAAIISISTVVF
jgi:prevent-host-death family protein